MDSKAFEIKNGPSKFSLSFALFGEKRGENNNHVEFSVADPTLQGRIIIIHVAVQGIEAEDGSREAWNIWGYKTYETGAKKRTWNKVKIHFRTDRRSGCLQILD